MQAREDLRDIQPCRNRSGSDIPPHRILMRDVDQGVDAYEVAVDASAPLLGVSLQTILDGYNGDMARDGLVRVEAGAAISVGAKVTAGADGKGAASTTDEDHVIGEAQTEATLDGDIIEVFIKGGVTQNASA